MKITKKDVKGILKVLLIIILVAAAIGGTCYFFFKQFNKDTDSYTSVSNYVYSIEREEFTSSLEDINSTKNSNGRLDSAITTLNNLTTSTKALAPYLSSVDVNDKAINKNLKKLISSEQNCLSSINEYLDRTADPTFDKSSVNKLQTNLAIYLIDYANLLNNINSEIESSFKYKQVDIKFAVIDCYTRVVVNTFSNLSTDVVAPKDTTNLKVFEGVINFDGTKIVVNSADYTNNLNFTKFYNNSDKSEFAKNLSKNIKDCSSFNNNYSDLQKASYYFGVIFKEAE